MVMLTIMIRITLPDDIGDDVCNNADKGDDDDDNDGNIGSLKGLGPFHFPEMIVVHLSVSVIDGCDADNDITNCNNSINKRNMFTGSYLPHI